MQEQKDRMALSVMEMAEALGISRPTAYELIHRADFPTVRIGKRVLIPASALSAWLDHEAGGGGDYGAQ